MTTRQQLHASHNESQRDITRECEQKVNHKHAARIRESAKLKAATIEKGPRDDQQRSNRGCFEDAYPVFDKRKLAAQPIEIIVGESDHADRHHQHKKRAVWGEGRGPCQPAAVQVLGDRSALAQVESSDESTESEREIDDYQSSLD